MDEDERAETCSQPLPKQTNTFTIEMKWEDFVHFLPKTCATQHTRLVGEWTHAIYKKFHEVMSSCPLTFHGNRLRQDISRKRNAQYWVGRAVCKMPGCISVTFSILCKPVPGDQVKIVANVCGQCNHVEQNETGLSHSCSKKRNLKGGARAELVADILQSGTESKSQYLNKLAEMNVEELKAGNTTHCQSPQVIRQAVFESRAKQRLTNDLFSELIIQMEAWDAALPGQPVSGYIQSLGHTPLLITFYTAQQVQLYSDICRHKRMQPVVLHFDSTGSVIKRFGSQKEPLYYTLLMADTNIPALEFITTCHTSSWIGNVICQFLTDVKKCGPHKPSVVITDFSFALINAVLRSFNDMSVNKYLAVTYRLLNGGVKPACNMTHLLICKAHLMKAMSMKLARCEKSMAKRKAALAVFTRLHSCKTIQVISKLNV